MGRNKRYPHIFTTVSQSCINSSHVASSPTGQLSMEKAVRIIRTKVRWTWNVKSCTHVHYPRHHRWRCHPQLCFLFYCLPEESLTWWADWRQKGCQQELLFSEVPCTKPFFRHSLLGPTEVRLLYSRRRSPGFSRLSIVIVRTSAPRPHPITLLSSGEATKCLGLSLNPPSVRNVVGAKFSVISAERAFKQLQRNMSQKCLPTHAEIQLILHFAKVINVETMEGEIYPYIGCSKLSCFLCTSFLKSFGRDGAAFKTLGSMERFTLFGLSPTSMDFVTI